MSDLCPCCGQQLPARKIIHLDEDRGLLVFDGSVVPLTPEQGRIFALLYAAAPRVVNREAIYAALYEHKPDCDQPEIKIIDVFVCKLRKPLKRVGLEINTAWGRGYWMRLPTEEGLRAAA